jgi:hypothetical protein
MLDDDRPHQCHDSPPRRASATIFYSAIYFIEVARPSHTGSSFVPLRAIPGRERPPRPTSWTLVSPVGVPGRHRKPVGGGCGSTSHRSDPTALQTTRVVPPSPEALSVLGFPSPVCRAACEFLASRVLATVLPATCEFSASPSQSRSLEPAPRSFVSVTRSAIGTDSPPAVVSGPANRRRCGMPGPAWLSSPSATRYVGRGVTHGSQQATHSSRHEG